MYKAIVDGNIIEKQTRKQLQLCLELEYGFEGVRGWFDKRKIPRRVQDTITYCELNGMVILDDSQLNKFDYIVTIDGQTYKNHHRKSLIQEVELNHDVYNVASWFDRQSIPQIYRDRVTYLEKNGVVVVDFSQVDYRYMAIVNGTTIKTHTLNELCDELELLFGFEDCKIWIPKKQIPSKYKDKIDYLEVLNEIIYDCNETKLYKYSLIIDEVCYESDNRQTVINEVEEDYVITGVAHWFNVKRVPTAYHGLFNKVVLNGETIFDINIKTYKFSITIDDRLYRHDVKKELIEMVEKEENITGVKNWYYESRIPYHYQTKFKLIKIDDEVIFDSNCIVYKYCIKVDNKEFKSNSRKELISQVEDFYGITSVQSWLERYKILQTQEHLFDEVYIDGIKIYPRIKRG